MSKFYTGIGSRNTPPHILSIMSRSASFLESLGFILRTGGADGADKAFMNGCLNPANMNVFIPWKNFANVHDGIVLSTPLSVSSVNLFHPAPHRLSPPARRLIERDWFQICGFDNQPLSSFVICWTPNAKPVGGTAQALRIASHFNIPVFNLASNDARVRIENKLISAGF